MKKRIYLSIVLLIVGISIGYFIPRENKHAHISDEVRFDQGKFTNPLLECEIGADTIALQKLDFSSKMSEFVENLKKQEKLADFSVYFRDMNNGPVVGVNQDFNFSPASLLKVPTLISYLSWSEEELGVLEKIYTYESLAKKQFTPLFPPSRQIVIGETYTVKDLLERMVIYLIMKLTFCFKSIYQRGTKKISILLWV